MYIPMEISLFGGGDATINLANVKMIKRDSGATRIVFGDGIGIDSCDGYEELTRCAAMIADCGAQPEPEQAQRPTNTVAPWVDDPNWTPANG